MLEQDEKSKGVVKKLNDDLGKVMNDVKAMMQRQQKMAQAAAQNGGARGGMDPKDAAKIQATLMTAQQKVQQMRESHAARTAQRKIQFQQEIEHERQRNQIELQREAQKHNLDIVSSAAKTGAEIQNDRFRAQNEPTGEE